jgi:hypothetical protein
MPLFQLARLALLPAPLAAQVREVLQGCRTLPEMNAIQDIMYRKFIEILDLCDEDRPSRMNL